LRLSSSMPSTTDKHESIDEQLEAQQAFLVAQEERVKLTDLRFKNGIASSNEMLDAQRDLFSAQQALIQTRQLRLNNAIALYRSLGGGLNETTQAVVVATPVTTTQ
ncbi:TolC family protein, partial [Glaciimonas sp. GG7]